MWKKITGNFGIDKCYFKYNSPFLAEKRVNDLKLLQYNQAAYAKPAH